ncbi:uncharacterized protein LOC110178399 isoform X2 [Drosophila serrata]|uniref:uncharacterized protein LOC110178399 isoform X2 n=1 Tax=Drosophila serrata TaxID=7274 RepID=UPI000A1D3625|nr:uncharacterized protein LOC110178399 isoform X2 [Drosophila serrata]
MKAPTGDKLTLADETEPPSSSLTSKKGNPRDKTNNNHHVVPLGILVVLCTVYLMAAGVQRNYRYYIRPGVAAFDLSASHPSQADETTDEELEASGASSCQQMEIFGKESDQKPSSANLISKRPHGKAIKRTKSGSGNGLVVGKQPRIAKYPDSGGRKKEAAAKKSNTAEPIIYLFALVFIYLLLKAASDINQHYKSNKGDKRLRRCSLQSYAQVHKQDRRSSKVPIEESPILRRRHILAEVRSVSVDRYKYTNLNEDYHHHRVGSPLASRPSIHYQHHHHHQLPFRPSPGDARFEPRMNRRSSVPISINYQTVHISSPPPEMARRGSVISLTDTSAMPIPSGTVVDPKRRVRMINRH